MARFNIINKYGISGQDGFMSEYFSAKPEYIFKIPENTRERDHLIEPVSILEKEP